MVASEALVIAHWTQSYWFGDFDVFARLPWTRLVRVVQALRFASLEALVLVKVLVFIYVGNN